MTPVLWREQGSNVSNRPHEHFTFDDSLDIEHNIMSNCSGLSFISVVPPGVHASSIPCYMYMGPSGAFYLNITDLGVSGLSRQRYRLFNRSINRNKSVVFLNVKQSIDCGNLHNNYSAKIIRSLTFRRYLTQFVDEIRNS